MRNKDQQIQDLQEQLNDFKTQNQLLKTESKKKSDAMAQDDSFIKQLQSKL